jgi:hypothetical protein
MIQVFDTVAGFVLQLTYATWQALYLEAFPRVASSIDGVEQVVVTEVWYDSV